MNALPKAGPGIALRPDLAAIAAMIPPSTRVLDIGCGDGALNQISPLLFVRQARNLYGVLLR